MENKVEEIKAYLDEYKKIFILRHQRPDLDAIGSQFGLFHILKATYLDHEIYTYGEDDIKEFNYIGKNDIVDSQSFKNSLIFVLDTANIDRIEGDYKSINNMSNKVIKIDHHPNLEPFGHINIVEEGLSSTSELVYKIFIKKMNLKLNKDSAKALFAGIYTDTGGFSYSNTTSKTFKTVSELVKYDFDFEDLMLNIKELDENSIRVLGYMYLNIQIDKGVGVVKFDKQILKENNFNKKNISMLVNLLGIIKNLKAWILMVEHDNFIRVNLRSKRDINVSKIANRYEGGGHKNASGARIYSWQESNHLIQEVLEEVEIKSNI